MTPDKLVTSHLPSSPPGAPPGVVSPDGDLDWAHTMCGLLARGGDEERMVYVVIPGEPWSKSRPKFARRTGHAYQPRDDRQAEQALRARLRASRSSPFPGNVMLACRFYRPNQHRIDADNMLKHVCDSANGLWWADDSQVTLILGEILYDATNPRTVIVAGHHASTLLRGADRAKPCPRCGEVFRPKTTGQKHCSRSCADASRRRAGQPKTPNRSRCEECGVDLAHSQGGRCRSCGRQNPTRDQHHHPVDPIEEP